ncbi:hypothetical protein [Nocardia carnea]|uniref:hypothetical protein n=1 Tax=Nocardia carnea TaxID=37328 RepID=UPI002458E525|nr:hypothetical protein [Nocardia carnea]
MAAPCRRTIGSGSGTRQSSVHQRLRHIFLSYVAFSGTLYYVTLMFQNLLGWSALRTGPSWLLMNVPFLVAAQTAGKLSQRCTPRAITTTGCSKCFR